MGTGIWNAGASGNKTLVRGKNDEPTTILSESFVELDPTTHDQIPKCGVWTVQFDTYPIDGTVPSDQTPTKTYAQIIWTIGGNNVKRGLSVASGQSLTGVGTGCVVNVFDDTNVVPGGDPVPDYVVTATLSPGSRGNSGNPPTFFPNDYVLLPSGTVHAQGGSSGMLTTNGGGDNIVVYQIPPGIGAISVQVTVGTEDGSAPDVIIQQQDSGGANVKVYNNNNYPGFVPIDPRAAMITIKNHSAASNAFWGITFGIDG